MTKVKLPRKRKKAYIKANSRSDYRMLQLVIELLMEEGKSNDRFYQYGQPKTKAQRLQSVNGLFIIKRW